MVVPPSTGAGPATALLSSNTPAAAATDPSSKDKSKDKQAGDAATSGTSLHVSGPSMPTAPIPLSARRSAPLNLETVERRGQKNAAPEVVKRNRLHGIAEAPTFRPTLEEFKDPMEYMRKIAPEGAKYGIAKIIPPDGWEPTFAIDTERFHFRVRRQELNSVEGGTRANLNYLDQLSKFHRQHGNNLNRFPSVDKRPLNLYKLKKAVEARGGFERVCKYKKWAEIGRDLGYSGKIMSSLSTSLKNSYQRWLYPYEQYLRVAKPGVQHQLELENGGPFTPSPGPSPLKPSEQSTPNGQEPAIRASAALNASLGSMSDSPNGNPSPAPETPSVVPRSSGFTPVNAGGFTAVNTHPPQASGFTSVNGPASFHLSSESSMTPRPHLDSPHRSAHNTPAFRSVPESASLKRLGSEGAESCANGEPDASGRRSKRQKKDNAPMVAGSHMNQPRLSTPRFVPMRDRKHDLGEACETCGKSDNMAHLLLCDSCDCGYHTYCLEPQVKSKPEHDWHCPRCLVGTGEFGFEDGEVYSLKQFQERANRFKEKHFANKMAYDPILNDKRPVGEDDVEREFWRLVESITETVEVEYGADIHSTTHGSGFTTIEKQPRDPYSTDPWNLNVLPLHGESLFKHIKTDISGMTVPWLYVGMVFSTFCWHNEDHYAYSANYQHLGATKTWYGVPGEDAEKFENAMREAVPELFEAQPDLLFQLVTLMPPEKLKKAGVRVFALDQRAGQFVITFPQAYHAGFNHGFNVNEAVNFAPVDWEPFGESGVQRLKDYRRQPCFSHDELLLTAASRDTTIKTAKWLAPALERLLGKEVAARKGFLDSHSLSDPKEAEQVYRGQRYSKAPEMDTEDLEEDDYICSFCKCFSFLSRYVCKTSGKVMCLLHAGGFGCCDADETERYASPAGHHVLYHRMADDALEAVVQKVVDKSKVPEVWAGKVDKLLDDEPRPSIKALRTLVNEGERIPCHLPQLNDLKRFVERCNEWIDEASSYITRKQQSRTKTSKPGRKSFAKAAEAEERERELRNVDNIRRLLTRAEDISFDCPEITILQERADSITDWQVNAKEALTMRVQHPTQYYEDICELGKSFNVDLVEIEQLDKLVQRMKWNDAAIRHSNPGVPYQNLKDVEEFIQQGLDLGVPEGDPHILYHREMKHRGEMWEQKANEVMSVENVHYQQLDALSKQAATLPVTPETLAKVDAILKKNREAHEKILALYHQSQSPNFRDRPMYMEVRDVMSALEELNSKPAGTMDLGNEQKRHEDWMRRGKKLFGKANAPLHILHQHLSIVKERNDSCFELRDKPRTPVEPSSRKNTPEPGKQGNGDPDSFPEVVFCLCRRPEAGMMIECELCHEWYHGKCLKIARGKVHKDDHYTCPICDWRVKIPRDAARPKLEELQAWQDEIETLPFQPEEEETLASIINVAQAFRDSIRAYCSHFAFTGEEVTNLRFYLRKVEGADILLTFETNFLRQELHKWAPVAPVAPPLIEQSGSTRKPRPTKLQKLMAAHGITDPEELPPQYKIKTHKRKGSEAGHTKPPASLQPAGSSPMSHHPMSVPNTMPGNGHARPGVQQQTHNHQTPLFTYPHSGPTAPGPIVTSSYRDATLFAPSFSNHGAGSLQQQGHLSQPRQAYGQQPTSRFESSTVDPAHFSRDRNGFPSQAPPSSAAAAYNGTSLNLDPALFGTGGAASIFDKAPESTSRSPEFGPDQTNQFGSSTNSNHLDPIFADMVHDGEEQATLGQDGGLAGEAFAASEQEADEGQEGQEGHMDEFV